MIRVSFLQVLLLLLLVVFAPAVASAFSNTSSTCTQYTFSNNHRYANCNPLPVLDSFLHWDYHPSTHTVDIAYRQTGVTASNWVAWSLNPSGPRMIGSQCIVAFVNSSTGVPHPFTSPITGYGTTLQEGPLSFGVPRIAAEFNHATSEMIIFATIELPPGRTNFTHLWQYGTVSTSGAFLAHSTSPDHMKPFANIDFATGRSTTVRAAAGSKQTLRRVHGIINVVSWGIMMPVGAMMARYVKVFVPQNPLWFKLHVTCQCLGYALGVAGVGTGLYLGRSSGGATAHPAHKYLGIAVFVLSTIQVLSLRLRPKPDAKMRWLWNWYHRTIGYGVIVMSNVNIFLGLDILDPGKVWRTAFVVYVAAMFGFGLFLEAYAWVVVTRRNKREMQTQTPSLGDNAA